MNQLELKTKEIMQNRQKEVEKRKTYIPLKNYHQLGAPGARAPYITKSISLQIRNPNLYLRKVSERQLAQIIFVYLARENIEGGGWWKCEMLMVAADGEYAAG